MNLLFVLAILFYLNILKTEKILTILEQNNSRRSWNVIPAQVVNIRTYRLFLFCKSFFQTMDLQGYQTLFVQMLMAPMNAE